MLHTEKSVCLDHNDARGEKIHTRGPCLPMHGWHRIVEQAKLVSQWVLHFNASDPNLSLLKWLAGSYDEI